MTDEYLLLAQAAYLLELTKQQVESLIDGKKLDYVMCQGTRLIRVSDLAMYVESQKERFSTFRDYLAAENKSVFWMGQKKKFLHQSTDKGMMPENLTVPQVAFLLNLSRQGVHRMIREGKLECQRIQWPDKIRPVIYVRAGEVEKYVQKKEKKYALAEKYFKEKEKNEFWKQHSNDFEKKWTQREKEKNRRYYENQKSKIQKKASKSYPDRKAGSSGADETKR